MLISAFKLIKPFWLTAAKVWSNQLAAFWAHMNVACCALNDRYPSVAIAICAYPMRGFGAASLWFQHIGERVPSQVFQFIFLLISIPCFKLNNLFFKFVYALNQRRALRLYGKNGVLGLDDLPIEFHDLPADKGGIAQRYHALRNRLDAVERSKGLRDGAHIGDHFISPTIFDLDSSQ